MNGLPLQHVRTNRVHGFRLVFPDQGPNLVEARARRAVEAETRDAATLTSPERAHDARDVLALSVAQALEGGRAAILRPDHRRRLVAQGARIGLRPFEANLVIAIVQDGVRRGVAHTAPDERRLLALVPEPRPVASIANISRPADPLSTRTELAEYARLAFGALLLAAITTTLLIHWITG